MVAGLSEATKARLARLVAEVISPPLKNAGFRKTRMTWHRSGEEVWPVVDVQRSWGDDSDRTSFTLNWGLYVPGYPEAAGTTPLKTPKSHSAPVSGRVGGVVGTEDTWWEIEQGYLSRSFPPGVERDEIQCETELALMLDGTIRFLDCAPLIADVVALVESATMNGRDLRFSDGPSLAQRR